MERTLWIASCAALSLVLVAAGGGLLIKQQRWLDLAYQQALRAESAGQYQIAIGLYEDILDRSRRNPWISPATREQIRQRMNTLRYQQGYLDIQGVAGKASL
jgi:hypothetical protein